MPPEVEPGASESSSVRDDLLAAMKEVGGDTPEPETTPERPRDESGRFSPGEKDDSQPTRKVDTGSEQPARTPAESARPTGERAPVETPAPSGAVDSQLATAPPAWSGAVKAKWATLDPEIRSEILKRETDVHKQFTTNDAERNFGKEVRQVVAPYEALIRADGGTVPGAIASVLNTAYILRTSDPQTKARAIQQVCQQYGVDLNLVAQAPGPANPEVDQLRQQLQQLQGQWTQRQQQERQQIEQQVLTQVETFGQDPKHPHFKAVSAHMGALMQAGQAETMEQAYEMAVWARPELRTQLLAAQTAQQTQTQQTRQRTEKARAKAVSVRGGPGGYTAPNPNPNASVRESLEAAMAEVNGRL